jgi:hypothetical protein
MSDIKIMRIHLDATLGSRPEIFVKFYRPPCTAALFSRPALKNATECSPHRFVARLHIEPAAQMLVRAEVRGEVLAACRGLNSGACLHRGFGGDKEICPLDFRRQNL